MDTDPVGPIRYDEIAREAAQRQPACGSTTVIAVDGPSGSGKTSLADALARHTGAAVVHLDDIYPGWQGLTATPPMVARGILDRIAVGEIGVVPRWSWVRSVPMGELRVAPAPLLILDGVGSGSGPIRPFLSLLIWVDAPLVVRRQRALARDAGAYEPFWDVWAAQESELFATEQTRSRADLVVDTSTRTLPRR